MPYRYLDNIAIADVAFEAWDRTPEELFASAADATLNAMVENLEDIREEITKTVSLGAESLEMLLFQLLQELVFYKDAEQLLLRVACCTLSPDSALSKESALSEDSAPSSQKPRLTLAAVLRGERIDPSRHRLIVDVKAVTLHRFSVEQTPEGWRATIILDV